jgi:anti-sigma factor RsiW
MNCETCQSELIDFEHGELSPQRRAEVAQHLAGCPDCALESCRLRADLEGIIEAYAEAPSPDVRDRLRDRVEVAVRPRWWTRMLDVVRQPVPAYAAVAVAVAPLLVWGALSLKDSTKPVHPPSPPAITDYDGVANGINAPGVL